MDRRPPRRDAHAVNLSPSERRRLKQLTTAGGARPREVVRARILLLLDEGWAPVDVPDALGCGIATVGRVRRRYEEDGLDRALSEAPRPGQPKRLSERQSAKIVAMVCGPPPAGRARWTLELVAEYAVRRKIVPSVGRETVRVLLRDHDLKPWREKNVVRARTRR